MVREQLHVSLVFCGMFWVVQSLHRCLIPHQDFWDTPALLIPRIPSSEEETIPESVCAAGSVLLVSRVPARSRPGGSG